MVTPVVAPRNYLFLFVIKIHQIHFIKIQISPRVVLTTMMKNFFKKIEIFQIKHRFLHRKISIILK